MEAFATAIEASALGGFARQSAWAYPFANLVHLLGLVLLIGGIGIVDLRLAGAFRALPLRALSRALTPLAIAGLGCMAVSGPMLFAADAAALVRSDRFAWKLGLIVIALANAALFRLLWREGEEEPALPLRIMAVTSIGLWLTVAALGRLIAYA
ncbi:MAG: hypothetical protein JWM75_573 [Sphingomonas bacterium]|nr:hypothetical protein [Sphingomonas bacterium]